MWQDLWLIVKGYSNKATREREERAYYYREMYSLLYNVNRGEHSPILRGHEVYPLSIDNIPVATMPNEDEIRQAMEAAKLMSNGN